RGFLTGTAVPATEYPEGDFRRDDPRYQPGNFEENMRAAAAVHEIAGARGVTSAQVAIAWLLHKGEDIVPIPGTKRRRYLEENSAAADLQLDASEMERRDAALPAGSIAGERYTPAKLATIDR